MRFCREHYAAAIEGKRIPDALDLPLQRFCTIRGIRYHDGFATSLRGLSPTFTRTLNARDIMSDRVPDQMTQEEEPYCIWHPTIASEETYRRLAKKFPSMSYQVGRACAVAGYTKLYLELDIMPDVSIAEEAREAGSTAIFDHIMSNPVKHCVMNDYDRSIASVPSSLTPAHLNGDTAVRALLDVKQGFHHPGDPDDFDDCLMTGPGYVETTFNITEDMNVDVRDIDTKSRDLALDQAHSDVLVKLLTGPLPLELPTVDKDLLICMAAYNGDIDRYVRLRRPTMVDSELHCSIQGIYHSSMFAVWWSKQDLPPSFAESRIRSAVFARFIMNNVISQMPDRASLPYLIWYPSIARESTYRKLVRLQPDFQSQVLRACIVAGYTSLFDELVKDVKPDKALLLEAAESPDPRYREELEAREREVGLEDIAPSHLSWKLQTARQMQFSDNSIYRSVGLAAFEAPIVNEWDHAATPGTLYGGLGYNASSIQLLACLPDEWKIKKGDSDDVEDKEELDYVQWPPTEGSRVHLRDEYRVSRR